MSDLFAYEIVHCFFQVLQLKVCLSQQKLNYTEVKVTILSMILLTWQSDLHSTRILYPFFQIFNLTDSHHLPLESAHSSDQRGAINDTSAKYKIRHLKLIRVGVFR